MLDNYFRERFWMAPSSGQNRVPYYDEIYIVDGDNIFNIWNWHPLDFLEDFKVLDSLMQNDNYYGDANQSVIWNPLNRYEDGMSLLDRTARVSTRVFNGLGVITINTYRFDDDRFVEFVQPRMGHNVGDSLVWILRSESSPSSMGSSG